MNIKYHYLNQLCLVLFFFFCFFLMEFSQTPKIKADILRENIKQPNVQGVFYPQDKQKLNNLLDDLFEQAKKNIKPDIQLKDEHIYGIISPHAGYIYSGEVAAQSYQAIKNRNYKTIIILSPTHYFRLAKAAVYTQGGFETPLGRINIDELFTENLLKNHPDLFQADPEAFEKEHAVEVQLPFLQKTQTDFKIIPIIIPSVSYTFSQSIAKALTSAIGQRQDILLIASTDLSHYHQQSAANRIDAKSIDLILNSQPEQLFNAVRQGQCELCGAAAVVVLLEVMKNLQADNIQLLGYATSADSNYINNPDINRVVGYASIIFSNLKNKDTIDQRSKTMLSDIQKKDLIKVARESIVNIVKNKQKRIVLTDDPLLNEHRGAFVTVYKHNALRGCIGLIEADQALINVVNDMAIQASTKDPRFVPVSEQELDEISLEISVMSPIEQISDINQIEVGKHGLIIRKGYNSGLLLPQVASEYNWDRQQFLEQTCIKAGLNKDAWKENAQIYIFSAEVFGEGEFSQ